MGKWKDYVQSGLSANASAGHSTPVTRGNEFDHSKIEVRPQSCCGKEQ